MNKIIGLLLVLVFAVTGIMGQGEKVDSLMQLLQHSNNDSSRVTALNLLSWDLLGLSRYDQAEKYGREALVLAQHSGNKKGEGKALNNIGGSCWNRGKYPEALAWYFRALQTYIETKDTVGMAISYNNIGLVYWNQGKYSEALKAFLESLKKSTQTGDKSTMINAYNNVGIIQFMQGNYDEALKYYQASIRTSQEIGDKKGLLKANNNIALIYTERENYANALKTYDYSLKISEDIGDKKITAITYCNIGVIFFNMRNYDESLKNHYISLNIMDEIGTSYGKAINYIDIGRIHARRNQYREAGKWLDKALDISKSTGDNEWIKNSYDAFTELDSMTSAWKHAFEHYRKYILYRDSLTDIENTRKTLEAKMEYEYGIKEAHVKADHDKKEALAKAEIVKQKIIRNSIAGGTALLVFSSALSFVFYKRRRDAAFQKQEAEAKQQEAELKQKVSEVEMKALRSQMNPHFIFNSLNSIYRFMEKHDIENAGNYLVKFSKLIRLILENSMHAEVTLEEDVQALELYMQMESTRLNNKFDFSFEQDPQLDASELMVPPLLLQPFVENAIWHGISPKEGKGHITIRIKKKGENKIICEVEDNGVGRKKDAASETTKLVEKKGSLGVAITKERIELINRKYGTQAHFNMIDLTDAENKPSGLRVEVTLPLTVA